MNKYELKMYNLQIPLGRLQEKKQKKKTPQGFAGGMSNH